MCRKLILAVFLICFGIWLIAEETEPEHFRVTPADDGMITKEFIAKIRAGVGDEKASRASFELDDFVRKLMDKAKKERIVKT